MSSKRTNALNKIPTTVSLKRPNEGIEKSFDEKEKNALIGDLMKCRLEIFRFRQKLHEQLAYAVQKGVFVLKNVIGTASPGQPTNALKRVLTTLKGKNVLKIPIEEVAKVTETLAPEFTGQNKRALEETSNDLQVAGQQKTVLVQSFAEQARQDELQKAQEKRRQELQQKEKEFTRRLLSTYKTKNIEELRGELKACRSHKKARPFTAYELENPGRFQQLNPNIVEEEDARTFTTGTGWDDTNQQTSKRRRTDDKNTIMPDVPGVPQFTMPGDVNFAMGVN
jgi:hypothetical protein